MELVKKGAHLKSNCSADTCKYQFMIFYGYMPLCHVHLPLIVGSNPNFRCFIEKPRKWTDSSHDEAWKLESCAVGTTACDVPMRPAMIQCQWDFWRSSRMLWPEDTGMWNDVNTNFICDAVYRSCLYTLPSPKISFHHYLPLKTVKAC